MDNAFVFLMLVVATVASLIGAHHHLEVGLNKKVANGALLLTLGAVLLLLTVSLLFSSLVS